MFSITGDAHAIIAIPNDCDIFYLDTFIAINVCQKVG